MKKQNIKMHRSCLHLFQMMKINITTYRLKKNLQKLIKQKKIKLTNYKIQNNSYPVQF